MPDTSSSSQDKVQGAPPQRHRAAAMPTGAAVPATHASPSARASPSPLRRHRRAQQARRQAAAQGGGGPRPAGRWQTARCGWPPRGTFISTGADRRASTPACRSAWSGSATPRSLTRCVLVLGVMQRGDYCCIPPARHPCKRPPSSVPHPHLPTRRLQLEINSTHYGGPSGAKESTWQSWHDRRGGRALAAPERGRAPVRLGLDWRAAEQCAGPPHAGRRRRAPPSSMPSRCPRCARGTAARHPQLGGPAPRTAHPLPAACPWQMYTHRKRLNIDDAFKEMWARFWVGGLAGWVG